MKYFSIDYRSPPSGLGQIIDTTQPEMIEGKYNYILISYSGCGAQINPSYIKTKYFSSEQAQEEGWAGPVLEEIILFLQSQEVTHVYDSELSYNNVGADSRGFFTLEKWTEIMRRFL